MKAPWAMLGQVASEVRPGHSSGQSVVKAPPSSGLRLRERLSNNAMQPTACAVGKQVKNSTALAPAAADGERWTDENTEDERASRGRCPDQGSQESPRSGRPSLCCGEGVYAIARGSRSPGTRRALGVWFSGQEVVRARSKVGPGQRVLISSGELIKGTHKASVDGKGMWSGHAAAGEAASTQVAKVLFGKAAGE